MPRNIFTFRQLPREKPDRCELCPLVGIIPKSERRAGKRERYYCLGIIEEERDENDNPVLDENGVQQNSFPRLSSKGICVSAKSVRDGGHVWHRPCDLTWDSWMTIPGRIFSMPTDVYITYRLPFEQEQMIKRMPKLPFRIRKKK